MLIVRHQHPFLIKESSSHLWILILQLLSTFTSSARSVRLPFSSSFPCLRVHFPVLVICILMTHIGFHWIWGVVIVLHLSSWSDDPHLFLSSFNPYLSDPLPLLLLIHHSHNVLSPLFFLSHDIIIVLLTFEGLSHYLVTVTHCTSHTLGTINV